MDGFLLIDKEIGWTSRDVCNKIQGMFHTKKVGHIGTLDPFATGLLIVSLGKATKAGSFLNESSKAYVAELVLGEKTSTGDIDGEIINKQSVPEISNEKIVKVFSNLIGDLEQIPPMTSAIHFNGRKLYELAHEGIEVERKPRKITISSINLIKFSDNIITFECVVSKGTYVRCLGETIAERLNTVGYLKSLRRIAIGCNNVEDAKVISLLSSSDVKSVLDCLKHMEIIKINGETEKKVKNGIPLSFNSSSDRILLVNDNDEAIAVYELNGGRYTSLRGLW